MKTDREYVLGLGETVDGGAKQGRPAEVESDCRVTGNFLPSRFRTPIAGKMLQVAYRDLDVNCGGNRLHEIFGAVQHEACSQDFVACDDAIQRAGERLRT
jgi:hypothetical protein